MTKTHTTKQVAILMGSDSDYPVMKEAENALQQFGISYDVAIVSAHRTPAALADYATNAAAHGIRVIIAGAGGAAHLPGMLAAYTPLPVIGVPVPMGAMQGQDALWSIVQMPKGVPVATVAIGNAWNAGILAAQILAAGGTQANTALLAKIQAYKAQMAQDVKAKNKSS